MRSMDVAVLASPRVPWPKYRTLYVTRRTGCIQLPSVDQPSRGFLRYTEPVSEADATIGSGLVAGKQITRAVSLLKPLSSGGMGAVWLADHHGLKTQVVVKFMLGG